MAATVEITFNPTGWNQGLAKLAARYPDAAKRAVNRATTSARVVMVREVARDLGLRQADIQDAISVRAAIQLSPDRIAAQIRATGKRIGLIKFGARQTRTGVTAKLPGGKGKYPSAFIATMGSGHTGVFLRKGAKRLPIVELFGPSVPKVFEKYIPLGAARGLEQLMKNMVSEIRFAMRG